MGLVLAKQVRDVHTQVEEGFELTLESKAEVKDSGIQTKGT